MRRREFICAVSSVVAVGGCLELEPGQTTEAGGNESYDAVSLEVTFGGSWEGFFTFESEGEDYSVELEGGAPGRKMTF
ncbi:MAG: hypothetical protein SXQ77_03825, partial [Halobacteria archaeon]|nr:hypothetical protein [Halobacteria archaeon]